jgi:hypothetical protein
MRVSVWLRVKNLESGVHESVAGDSWRRVGSSGHSDIGRSTALSKQWEHNELAVY